MADPSAVAQAMAGARMRIAAASSGWESLGRGYTSRTDTVPGTDIVETHVYEDTADFRAELKRKNPNLRPHEKGIVGPDGQWLRKHGHESPPDLPNSVNNKLRGIVVNNARARGWLADRGTAFIKGKNLVHRIHEGMQQTGSYRYLRGLGTAMGIVGGVQSMMSIENACEMNPAFDGC